MEALKLPPELRMKLMNSELDQLMLTVRSVHLDVWIPCVAARHSACFLDVVRDLSYHNLRLTCTLLQFLLMHASSMNVATRDRVAKAACTVSF